MMRLLVLAGVIGAAVAEPCAGDLTKNVGDSWLCANKCDTCTCNDDGSITAAGCYPEDATPPEEQVFSLTRPFWRRAP